MNQIIMIFTEIIIPVFVLIGIGVILHRKFKLDMYTLAKLNIYFLVPGLIFVNLYNTQFSMNVFLDVFLFIVVFMIILYLISLLVSYLFRFNKSMRVAFSNSILFYNSGNYGVPVNDLMFRQDPFAMSIQVIVLTFQNILTFSYGIFVLQSINGSKVKAMLGYFKMPVLYALLLGVGFNVYQVPVPVSLYIPATYIADALIAIALITLGAQIAHLRFTSQLKTIYVSLAIRLLIGPLIALGIIYGMGIDGVMAQALLISSTMPTSVNSAIIAQEYNNEPDFSAQVVLASTLLSAITVTTFIFIARHLF